MDAKRKRKNEIYDVHNGQKWVNWVDVGQLQVPTPVQVVEWVGGGEFWCLYTNVYK